MKKTFQFKNRSVRIYFTCIISLSATTSSLININIEEQHLILVVTKCRMAMDQDPEHQGCPFVEEPGITDVALVVEGKKLFVNKFVLAVASPVFKKMFTSEFKEKDTSEVELPGKKYKDVLEFLMCIYPNIMKSVNFDTITQVLPLMHEYDCKKQVENCNSFLMKMIDPKGENATLDKMLLCLSQTHMTGLTESYEKCLDSVSRYSSKSFLSSEEFLILSPEIKEDVYKRRIEKLEETGRSVVDQLNYKGMVNNYEVVKKDPFSKEFPFSDVMLVVEYRKLLVNKAILSLASPVFKKMFFSDFKFAKEVPLPGKNYQDVVAVLNRIYSHNKEPLTIDIVVQVLPLLHEYDCKRQILECEEFLRANVLPKNISQDTLLQCLNILNRFGLQKTFEHCLQAVTIRTARSLENFWILREFPDSVKVRLYFKTLQNSCTFTGEWATSIRDQVDESMKKLCSFCKKMHTTKQLSSLSDKFNNDVYYN